MRRLACAALLLIGATMPASAQQETPLDCANAVTQMDMNQCAYLEHQAADKILNRVYKQAMADARQQDVDALEMGPNMVGAVNALKKAQRAWIDYRDGTCKGMGFKARGGSLEPLLVESCLKDMTETRTKELRELVQKPGN